MSDDSILRLDPELAAITVLIPEIDLTEIVAARELEARLMAQGRSPLEVMNISNDRQPLESGSDLLTVSGRIINPTGTSQPVPPLRAELLDASKSKVIHSWMISPPVDSLSPNESSTFHSAEMGVPEGGKFLRVRLSTEG